MLVVLQKDFDLLLDRPSMDLRILDGMGRRSIFLAILGCFRGRKLSPQLSPQLKEAPRDSKGVW
jgi:hypothetical protein